LAWPADLQLATGAAVDGDRASVVIAFAGIAETGTVMLLSSPSSPATLNFLPEMHIVILPEAAIVGAYEDAWTNLRATLGPGVMPRVVNWITGPSRTADIEQTLLLGAHGPRLLHILLLAEA
ncbi:MAG: LUD domain-containing protein, partial [Defluviicoccus sp.]